MTSWIRYEVNTQRSPPEARLAYTFTNSQVSVDYSVPLATTRPRFGGLRWWFVCPLQVGDAPCGRRVGKLYLPPAGPYFGCRHCHDLTYTSCRESHKFDRLHRHIAATLGWDEGAVKRVASRIGKDGI
jgi:hypothetical protein